MQHFPHTVSAKRKRKNAFKRPSFGAFLVAGTLLDLTFFQLVFKVLCFTDKEQIKTKTVTWITQNIGFNPILRKSETVCKKNINPIL